jgi:hypothetical protein
MGIILGCFTGALPGVLLEKVDETPGVGSNVPGISVG